MNSRQTFRYPQRTRIRALELAYAGLDGCSVLRIIEVLKTEGHGDVKRNAVERWLRDSAAQRATQAAALGQRVRHEAERINGGKNDPERILSSVAQLADLTTIAAKRASEEVPNIEINSPTDLARMVGTLIDIYSSSIEGLRVVRQLQNAGISKKNT